jgi:hypothetical protein
VTELQCWLVVDDSGSMSGYSEVTKRLYNELRHTLENSFLVRTYKTSTQGLRMYRGEAPGQGGGDGFRYIGELIRSTRREALPTFVIYLTDSGADLELTHSNLLTYKILMVDVTAPWITGSGSPTSTKRHIRSLMRSWKSAVSTTSTTTRNVKPRTVASTCSKSSPSTQDGTGISPKHKP